MVFFPIVSFIVSHNTLNPSTLEIYHITSAQIFWVLGKVRVSSTEIMSLLLGPHFSAVTLTNWANPGWLCKHPMEKEKREEKKRKINIRNNGRTNPITLMSSITKTNHWMSRVRRSQSNILSLQTLKDLRVLPD